MKQSVLEKSKSIVSFVKANGGTIAAASRAVEIKLTPAVRAKIKELAPDIDRWRYAFIRSGSWLSLPTDIASSRSAQKINCVCTNCGAQVQVNLLNLVSGRSLACRACAMKNKARRQVMCQQTDEVFSSIRDFVRTKGLADQYQGIRHTLASGNYSIDNQTSVLTS